VGVVGGGDAVGGAGDGDLRLARAAQRIVGVGAGVAGVGCRGGGLADAVGGGVVGPGRRQVRLDGRGRDQGTSTVSALFASHSIPIPRPYVLQHI